MQAQKIRRITRNALHKIRDPRLAIVVTSARGTDEAIMLLLPQRHDVLEPEIRGLLGRNAVALRLVEVEDDMVFVAVDGGPVVAGELAQVVDHGPEGGAVFQLRWGPGVPVADGCEGAGEFDVVHGPWYAGVAGAVGVGPVPEEAAFVNHGGGGAVWVVDEHLGYKIKNLEKGQ